MTTTEARIFPESAPPRSPQSPKAGRAGKEPMPRNLFRTVELNAQPRKGLAHSCCHIECIGPPLIRQDICFVLNMKGFAFPTKEPLPSRHDSSRIVPHNFFHDLLCIQCTLKYLEFPRRNSLHDLLGCFALIQHLGDDQVHHISLALCRVYLAPDANIVSRKISCVSSGFALSFFLLPNAHLIVCCFRNWNNSLHINESLAITRVRVHAHTSNVQIKLV